MFKDKKIVQKKSLSQVFLQDPWPCKMLADLVKDKGVSQVLEIGPGKGILTRELLESGLELTCVEKDERFVKYLTESDFGRDLQKKGSLKVFCEDVVSFDFLEWLKLSEESKAICGNIPYHISTPILFAVLPYLSQLKGVWFLVQLEFAERLASLTRCKSYGSLSVYTQLRADVTIECVVDKSLFYPVPKVDSAIVSLCEPSKKYSDYSLRSVEKLTKICFSQRRKMLSNSLKPLIQKHHNQPPIDLSRRCDSLTPKDFVTLAEWIFPQKKEGF